MTSLLWDSGSRRLQKQATFSCIFQSISWLFPLWTTHCFLGLADLSIHKQRKTQASWVSATDSYGEKKITSCPPAAFRASSESRTCKEPIFRSVVLLSYRSCSTEKLSGMKPMRSKMFHAGTVAYVATSSCGPSLALWHPPKENTKYFYLVNSTTKKFDNVPKGHGNPW